MRYRVEDDPLLKALIREQETAIREYRRALVELRRLYTSDTVDIIKAASLQLKAHDAEHKLIDTNRAFSQFAWEIVPHSIDEEHLERIKEIREEAQKRVSVDDVLPLPKGKVVIITTINGVKKRFVE